MMTHITIIQCYIWNCLMHLLHWTCYSYYYHLFLSIASKQIPYLIRASFVSLQKSRNMKVQLCHIMTCRTAWLYDVYSKTTHGFLSDQSDCLVGGTCCISGDIHSSAGGERGRTEVTCMTAEGVVLLHYLWDESWCNCVEAAWESLQGL